MRLTSTTKQSTMSTRGPSRRSEAAAPAFDVAFDPQDEEEDGVGPPIDDEDDEGRCPSSSIILILVLQRSLVSSAPERVRRALSTSCTDPSPLFAFR